MGTGLPAGKREEMPMLLKVGVALFLSFAGLLHAHLWFRDDRRHGRPPRQRAAGEGVKAGRETGNGPERSSPAQSERASTDVRDGTIIEGIASPTAGLSPGKNLGDEGYLLPEFDELIRKELESFGLEGDALETVATNGLLQHKGERVSEEEIFAFKNLIKLLQDRVSSLEMQLLEYYGLREQQSVARELENRLKVSNMEAKILSLKFESLQAENRRLGDQLSDYARIRSELDLARSKIKHLESGLQANEKVTELQCRISSLQDGECRDEVDIGLAENKLKHLHDVVAELRGENSRLVMENSDLAKKLSSQLLATSPPENSLEVNEVLAEANRLRQINDELTKEIAQLQSDRCADVEELVYLRWINACLRYELRNCEPPPGKDLARDLSWSMSPKSEQRAKQLISEYATSGIIEKNICVTDFDSEHCSSSRSSLTENGEADNFSVDARNGGSGKSKFLKKLKKLVLGKDHRDKASSTERSPTSCGTTERRASISAFSFDELMNWSSYDSGASCITSDSGRPMAVEAKSSEQQDGAPWTRNLSRVSLDFQKLKSHDELGDVKHGRRRSDVGSSCRQILGAAATVRASKSPDRKPKRRTRSASFV